MHRNVCGEKGRKIPKSAEAAIPGFGTPPVEVWNTMVRPSVSVPPESGRRAPKLANPSLCLCPAILELKDTMKLLWCIFTLCVSGGNCFGEGFMLQSAQHTQQLCFRSCLCCVAHVLVYLDYTNTCPPADGVHRRMCVCPFRA